ncbi:MAG: D-alanine--D-alanine ligase, partial [Nitrospirota bacterium]
MKLLTAKRIAVLMGGQSAEHEISIRSGRAVWTALIQKGYDAIPLEVDSSVVGRLREVRGQIAFIALHGPGGEDGTIQGMLEVIRIPYTGSGVQACAVAMDKAMTKVLLEQNGVPGPRGFVLEQGDRRKPLPSGFKLPLVVKPVSQGSTLGITIVRKSRNLQKALDAAFAYGPAALIEEYIDGREFTVGILNDKALPVVEIIPQGGFY